jgi:hypothetical protein
MRPHLTEVYTCLSVSRIDMVRPQFIFVVALLQSELSFIILPPTILQGDRLWTPSRWRRPPLP